MDQIGIHSSGFALVSDMIDWILTGLQKQRGNCWQ